MSNARYGLRTLTLGEVRTLARRNVLPFVEGYFSDLFGVPSAVFSLRKLTPNSVYSGAVIKVRRSNDNAEQDINFVSSSPDAGIDTTDMLNFVGAGNDGFVTTWYDQSGNARNWTQATAANQPRIVVSGAVEVDSKSYPSMIWNKTRLDKLENNALNVADLSWYRLHETSDTQYLTIGNGGAEFNYVAQQSSGTSGDGLSYGTSTLFTNGSQITSPTRNDVYVAQDGRKIISERALGKGIWSRLDLGAHGSGFAYSGRIHEMIFYFSDNFATQFRQDIEANIDTYYDVL